MASICIIPARGGSKRIPRKNIRDFLGKPIIAYSIEAAIKSRLFEEVMVSTDDEEIAKIAKAYGATVPFLRSNANSNDFSTTIDVLFEVLDTYTRIFSKVFDNACCIYATSPLISTTRLEEGFDLLNHGEYKSVISAVRFGYPIWRSLQAKDKYIEFIWPQYKNTRSQDLPVAYHDAGQWYWFKPKDISDSLINDCTGIVPLSELEVQDIDNESDWKLAELKYTLLSNG